MPLDKKDKTTRVVLRKLAIITPLYYVIYYAVSAVLCLAFGLFEKSAEVFWKLPFDEFLKSGDNFSFSKDKHLAAWLAMVLTYCPCGIAVIFWIIRAHQMAWDYTCTLTLVHFIACCIVAGAFPTSWIWWTTLAGCTVVMAGAGEFACYWRDTHEEIEVEH
eukprot:COSAG05_NODE_4867_length_1343_cov_1.045820_1_plen_161_part_00